jgi:uncharacterized protein
MNKMLQFMMIIVLSKFITLNAASFECSNAKTAIEKMICSDSVLSSLDDTIYKSYIFAIDSADSPQQIIKTQKSWLNKIRSQCKTKECLAKVYNDRIRELKSFKKYTWAKFHDSTLNIEFLYPTYLTIQPNYNDNSIYVNIVSMRGSDIVIHFKIHAGDLDKGISESDIFTKKGEVWYAHIGRFDNPPAESISGHGWKGLKTTITCGISYSDTGFHAAGGKCLWAVISDGKKYIVADTQGILGNDDNTLKLFMSIKFIQ